MLHFSSIIFVNHFTHADAVANDRRTGVAVNGQNIARTTGIVYTLPHRAGKVQRTSGKARACRLCSLALLSDADWLADARGHQRRQFIRPDGERAIA